MNKVVARTSTLTARVVEIRSQLPYLRPPCTLYRIAILFVYRQMTVHSFSLPFVGQHLMQYCSLPCIRHSLLQRLFVRNLWCRHCHQRCRVVVDAKSMHNLHILWHHRSVHSIFPSPLWDVIPDSNLWLVHLCRWWLALKCS